jgi:type IV pilus assembly protein PilE
MFPSHLPLRSTRPRGFTLIELLVVVSIVGVLAAVAMPSYTSYMARGKRADARTQLLQAAQFMQRFYAANDRYDQDRVSPTPNPVANQMPASLKKSPADGTTVYELEILTPTPTAYELRMNPTGAMASDKCGSFTLTSTGVRGVRVGGVAGSTTLRDSCWK